ncbi:tRNA pseudouridine(38-40) synthase TruA, partial [Eubacterium callanderi]
MKNIQMIIAYKGTHYAGWQRQPNAPTVEEVLTGAIKAVTGETVTLYGSGRTDAGVHALGQSANFHTESRVPPERFAAALNTRLPGDIRVLSSCEATEGFHSRYSAKGKVYTYQFYLNPVSSPFYAEYSWHVNYP